MVVQRSHLEDALVGHLVVADLQDVRADLQHEDDADQRQQQDLPGDQRYDGQCRAHGERACVTHEHLRGVDVEPQEAQQGTDDQRAQDREVGLPAE